MPALMKFLSSKYFLSITLALTLATEAVALERRSICGVVGSIPNRQYFRAISQIETQGGFTMYAQTGDLVERGPYYAVAIRPDRNQLIRGKPSKKQLSSYIAKNADLLRDPGFFVGAWNDKLTGVTELDIVQLIPKSQGLHQAARLGNRHRQRAIFDLEYDIEIRIGFPIMAHESQPRKHTP